MLKVESLRTIAQNAADLDRAERFYTQVLGGEVTRRGVVSSPPGMREVSIRGGNINVNLCDGPAGGRASYPHHTANLGWRPEEEARRELDAAGIAVESRRQQGQGPGYSLYSARSRRLSLGVELQRPP